MSTVIALRELRNDISGVLRRVRAGESFTVSVRGEPVAELRPIAPRPQRFVPAERLAELLEHASADHALLAELRDMDVDDDEQS